MGCEDPVFRVMRTMSRAEVIARGWAWTIAAFALLGALVADALLFATICNGDASPWAMPFALAFGLWVVMAGPRASARSWLYTMADCERQWWDEWRDRNGLAKDGDQ